MKAGYRAALLAWNYLLLLLILSWPLLKDRQGVSRFHTTRTDIFKAFGRKLHYIQYLLVGSACAMSCFPYLEMSNVKGSHE